MPKQSIISNSYWTLLEREKNRQKKDKGFYRKSNWSEDFKVTKPEPDKDKDGDYYVNKNEGDKD